MQYTAPQAGSSRVRIPMGSLEFLVEVVLSAVLMVLGLTQPITEMNTTDLPWGGGGKGGRCVGKLTTLMCRLSRNSGSLNLLKS